MTQPQKNYLGQSNVPILLEIKRTGLPGKLAGLMHPGEARSAAITATFQSATLV